MWSARNGSVNIFGIIVNLAILLGSIKVPYEEIKRWIIEMDEEKLNVGIIEQLIKYLPEPEQMKQLAGLKDEVASLADPEQFGVMVCIHPLCISSPYT